MSSLVKKSKIEIQEINEKGQNFDLNQNNNHSDPLKKEETFLQIAKEINIFDTFSNLNQESIGFSSNLFKEIQQIFIQKFSSISELKMWLIDSLCQPPILNCIHKKTKKREFFSLLENEREIKTEFSTHILLSICKNKKLAPQAAKIISQYPDLLKSFFFDYDHPQRIKEWFTFKFSGDNTKGALALEQYLFMHRDKIWSKLKWNGKRNIPPVIAIYRKGLLMELDLLHTLLVVSKDPLQIQKEMELEEEIERQKQKMYQKSIPEEEAENKREEFDEFGRVIKKKTIEEILKEEGRSFREAGNQVPFWESEFFKESLYNGDFLQLDYNFFANVLLQILEGKKGSYQKGKVLDLLENYLFLEDFKVLSYQLLPLVDHKSILSFLERIVKKVEPYTDRNEKTIDKKLFTKVDENEKFKYKINQNQNKKNNKNLKKEKKERDKKKIIKEEIIECPLIQLIEFNFQKLEDLLVYNALLSSHVKEFTHFLLLSDNRPKFDQILNTYFPMKKVPIFQKKNLQCEEKKQIILESFLKYFLLQSSFSQHPEALQIIMENSKIKFQTEFNIIHSRKNQQKLKEDDDLDPLILMKKEKKYKKKKEKKRKKEKKESDEEMEISGWKIGKDFISLTQLPYFLTQLFLKNNI